MTIPRPPSAVAARRRSGRELGADPAFLVALAIGLLLGLERERGHSRKLPAGSQWLALLSLVGAVAASVSEWTVAIGLGGVSALLVSETLRFARALISEV